MKTDVFIVNGFFDFFETCINFNLENHVREYNGKGLIMLDLPCMLLQFWFLRFAEKHIAGFIIPQTSKWSNYTTPTPKVPGSGKPIVEQIINLLKSFFLFSLSFRYDIALIIDVLLAQPDIVLHCLFCRKMFIKL